MHAALRTKHQTNGSSCCARQCQRIPAESIAPLARLNGAVGNSALVAALQRSAGHPIEPIARTTLEKQFGYDFSQVRLHTDTHAAGAAASVKAKAFTAGSDIFFSRAHCSTATPAARALLAHELAHVIQQGRGGLPATGADGAVLEKHANRAAKSVINGAESVQVSGSAAPDIMRQPEDDDDEGSKAEERRREKGKDLLRKGERARAGKSPEQLVQDQADKELRQLEAEARSPGAKSWSLQKKKQKLNRFEQVLKGARMSQLEKNKRKGAYDEALRTPRPGRTAGDPQSKYVAGGPQLPGMDLRAGKDPYAQPDYSVYRRRPDGTAERLHVNLKSDKLHQQSPAQARNTARYNTEQAIRNSRHLPQGESIIISYARTPSKAVQEAMLAEHFRQGSPISEVRFGTATHRRSAYKGPLAPAPGTPSKKKAGKKAAPKRKAAAKPARTAAKITKAPAKPKTPKPARPKPARPLKSSKPKAKKVGPKIAKPPPAVPKPPAVNQRKVAKSAAPQPSVPPARPALPSAPRMSASKVPTAAKPGISPAVPQAPAKLPAGAPKVMMPRTNMPSRMPRGGGGAGMRGAGAEGLAALVEAIVVPIINSYMQEHYAESIDEEARQLIAAAVEGHRDKFNALIKAHEAAIQAAQAEGREVQLHVIVDTNWQDTDIGRVLTKASVARYELVFENGPKPKPYSVPRPGGLAGDIFRDLVGTSFSYEAIDIVLEGTDPVVRDQRISRRLIEAKMGLPGESFESLIIRSLAGDLTSLGELREYAAYRRELAGMSSDAGAGPAAGAYWSRMEALLVGPVEDVIAAAKAKNVSLVALRAEAAKRRDEAGLSSDAGAGPAASAYWSAVIRAIDAK